VCSSDLPASSPRLPPPSGTGLGGATSMVGRSAATPASLAPTSGPPPAVARSTPASTGRVASGPGASSACASGPGASSACASGPGASSACASGPGASSACASGPGASSACASGLGAPASLPPGVAVSPPASLAASAPMLERLVPSLEHDNPAHVTRHGRTRARAIFIAPLWRGTTSMQAFGWRARVFRSRACGARSGGASVLAVVG
jgi:hypothetical protein